MTQFIIQRILHTMVIIFILSVLTFLLLHLLPGDPVTALLGDEPTQEEIDRLRAELGLDDHVVVQYYNWLINVLQGDLGTSIKFRESVSAMILHRLPATVHIGIIAFIISIIFGLIAGVVASVRRGSWVDSLITTSANIGMSAPNFWLGFLAIYLFSIQLQWLPTSGYILPTDDFWGSLRHIIMPSLVLGTASISIIARQTRSSMLEVIRQDYIRTARAKGLKSKVVLRKHALKNAIIPVVTLSGLMLPRIIGGSVIVEQIFNINGLGRLMLTSVIDRDIIVVQGCVILISVTVALSNLLVDISYGYFDPRIRYK